VAVRKVFWEDPYAVRCEAVVVSVEGPCVTLDRTVAFACSGGQHSDEGAIGGRPILSAVSDGHEIVYILPEGHGLTPGDAVGVEIDWPHRYRMMRLHFAAELVLELVGQHFGRPEKTGADITAHKARIDFAWPGNIAETFPIIEARLRDLVEADLPIESAFSAPDTQRRVWRIEKFASVPCGGTHLRRTGEVGEVALKRANPGRGIERIEIRLREATLRP
jgi:Ser-tRNA(Ala) deacylase AlaX